MVAAPRVPASTGGARSAFQTVRAPRRIRGQLSARVKKALTRGLVPAPPGLIVVS